MKLYHGSNAWIGAISLARCLPYRDFGKGFYVTDIREHAEQRAKDRSSKDNSEPVVTAFDFDEAALTDGALSVKKFGAPSVEWVEFVMMNRNGDIPQPAHEHDIVEGPVANDKMYAQFALYEHGLIGMEEVLRRITYREATHQLAFCTEAAVALLKPEKSYAKVMIELTTGDLVKRLAKDSKELPVDKIMAIVYQSEIYGTLVSEATGLYRESSAYVYELLKRELRQKNGNQPA
ncbi:MAG: DUF3990 domain-containing protein [Prevotellaceae bacterium]|jgi:hypothetical protein|nr:DUF3990 domain-containing protein [Prevotellaceae bacterium]